MKITPRLVFAAVLVIVLVAFDLTALTFNYQARMMPLIIGVPVLLLAIVQLILEVQKAQGKGDKPPADSKGSTTAEPKAEPKRGTGVFVSSAWVVALLGSIYVLGFIITTFAYPFLYIKFVGKRSWRLAFSISLGAIAFIYIVMIMGLKVDLYDGIVMTAVRKSVYGY